MSVITLKMEKYNLLFLRYIIIIIIIIILILLCILLLILLIVNIGIIMM